MWWPHQKAHNLRHMRPRCRPEEIKMVHLEQLSRHHRAAILNVFSQVSPNTFSIPLFNKVKYPGPLIWGLILPLTPQFPISRHVR